MSHYNANVRDLEFNLFEVLDLEKALATGEFRDLDGEAIRKRSRRHCFSLTRCCPALPPIGLSSSLMVWLK
jgi:hypothetical protein